MQRRPVTSRTVSRPRTPNAPAAVSTVIAGFPGGTDTPIAFVDPADNLPHRFVATQEGVIFVWSGVTQTLLATPFLDLSSERAQQGGSSAANERGLLGDGGRARLRAPSEAGSTSTTRAGTASEDGDIVVERYTALRREPRYRRHHCRGGPPPSSTTRRSNHNGGQARLRSGRLPVHLDRRRRTAAATTAQGASGGRPEARAHLARQDPAHRRPGCRSERHGRPSECGLARGLLRDPFRQPLRRARRLPCNEVWALGLRNPFRFSFRSG